MSYNKAKVPSEVVKVFDDAEAARVRVEDYMHTNHRIIAEYEQLRSDANEKLAQAKAMFIKHKDILGKAYRGFKVETARHVDVKKLLELCPEAADCCKREITLSALQEAVDCGLIPEDVAEKVIEEGEKIKGPKQL